MVGRSIGGVDGESRARHLGSSREQAFRSARGTLGRRRRRRQESEQRRGKRVGWGRTKESKWTIFVGPVLLLTVPDNGEASTISAFVDTCLPYVGEQ